MRTPSRNASASGGVGAFSTAAGSTRSGTSYNRAHAEFRAAAVTSPAKNRYSSAVLTSFQFQPQLKCFTRSLGSSISAAATGPRSRTSSSTRLMSSGFSFANRDGGPHECPRAIRHRITGCNPTGSSEASCPQYSNSSRGPR
ncbi:hypothetical protein GCM10009557_53640 [Virgisporangium ochraceum]